MLQLPESKSRLRSPVAAKSATRRKTARNAAAPFYELEGSIGNAKLMASILSVLADKLVRNVHAYRGLSENFTADRMASDLSDPMEQLLFLSYELEKKLRDLDETFEAIVESNPRQEQR